MNTSPILSNALREQVLQLVDQYKAAANVSDSTAGRRAIEDSMFIGRLRRGESATLIKIDRLEAFLRERLSRPIVRSPDRVPDLKRRKKKPETDAQPTA